MARYQKVLLEAPEAPIPASTATSTFRTSKVKFWSPLKQRKLSSLKRLSCMARGFAASKTKREFLEKLGLKEGDAESEEIFRKMLDEATFGRQRLSQHPANLAPGVRDDAGGNKGPYTYSQILETARHSEILQIYRNASALTRPYYDRGHYMDGANEENWVVRWCLYHSFRYTDNRNRNRTRGQRSLQTSPTTTTSVHSLSSASPRMHPQSATYGSIGVLPPSRHESTRSTTSPTSTVGDDSESFHALKEGAMQSSGCTSALTSQLWLRTDEALHTGAFRPSPPIRTDYYDPARDL